MIPSRWYGIAIERLRGAHVATALLGCALLSLPARAQTPGTCELGLASYDLATSEMSASLYNGGNLFYGPANPSAENLEEARYVAPLSTGVSAIYAASLLIGGQVEGELRTVSATFNSFDLWPGPLGADGRPPEDCSEHDHIYSISRTDLSSISCDAELPPAVTSWPADLGAPVVDGDGIAGNYDPGAGDRPALFGDRMAWWVMNDVGNDHGEDGTPPIGMEVRATAFAFDPAINSAAQNANLKYSVFFRYELHYKGAAPLEDAYVGLYVDADLGDAADDRTATDTLRNLVYTYNGDPVDGVYGSPPPATGVTVLRGPTGDDGRPLRLEASPRIYKSFTAPYTEPRTASEFYHSLQGLFTNGDSMRVGGWLEPHPDSAATLFHYTGNPVTGSFWSEVNVDGEGTAMATGDRRFIVSSGPFDMQPGEVEVFEFAVLTAFGSDYLGSIHALLGQATAVDLAYDGIYSPSEVRAQGYCPAAPSPDLAYVRNHPDPAVGVTRFGYTLASTTHVRLRIFDVLGRQVATLVDERRSAGPHETPFDVGSLSPGVYFARFELLDVQNARPVVVTDPFVVVR